MITWWYFHDGPEAGWCKGLRDSFSPDGLGMLQSPSQSLSNLKQGRLISCSFRVSVGWRRILPWTIIILSLGLRPVEEPLSGTLPVSVAEEKSWRNTQGLAGFHPVVPYIASTHISLARASHVATTNRPGAENCNPTLCRYGEGWDVCEEL